MSSVDNCYDLALRLVPIIEKRKERNPEMISSTNILAHCYDSIEDRIVWGIIEDSLPSLLRDVSVLLS